MATSTSYQFTVERCLQDYTLCLYFILLGLLRSWLKIFIKVENPLISLAYEWHLSSENYVRVNLLTYLLSNDLSPSTSRHELRKLQAAAHWALLIFAPVNTFTFLFTYLLTICPIAWLSAKLTAITNWLPTFTQSSMISVHRHTGSLHRC